MSAEPLLRATDLTVTFASSGKGAQGLDLDLHAGEVLALVGESGSGKTVSALALLGLTAPGAQVSGTVTLAGQAGNLLAGPADHWRDIRGRRIAAVFQDPVRSLSPYLSVYTHLRLALRRPKWRERAATTAAARALLARVGLGADGQVDRILAARPHELSGGQAQRVAIALALAGQPEILIADEPTTALDVTVQAGILRLLTELAEQGMAVLLITHDLGVVAQTAHSVAVMDNGQLVERGPVQQILTRPTHPRTQALIAAVPRLERAGGGAGSGAPSAGDQPAAAPNEPGDAAQSSNALVTIDQATVTYRPAGQRPVQALTGVNLRLAPGQVLGVVGESGSGKSTLAHLVTGFLRPTSGQVRVEGRDPASGRARRAHLGRAIGIIGQDPASALNPRHTIAENLALPLRIHTQLTAAQRRERLAAALTEVGLVETFLARYPHELSGGQRQRVATARALLLSPRLVVADEPTSALDVTAQASIIATLRRLQATHGFAMLIISHDLAVIEKLATDIVVMRDGEIVEQGAAAEVLGAPQHPYTRQLLAAVPTLP
ncbi:dipeptide ABC transporter ATP-binding protein [Buchananella hordeovulneris]|uniref:dipeptide ABC transporter ATP-binding protein n=1 Tax=Buchananella hordeovulneris TaxID=52770 RepID=UPI0026DB1243|nr:ABC transporter ATP-binding protein [Buchananella hordeovulneris]MDO5080251.1 ABC transporter ATP-binding protein [Buchananella hordeovulneris]